MTVEPAAAKFRHPEKRRRPDNPVPRKPPWIRVKAPVSKGYLETRAFDADGNTYVSEQKRNRIVLVRRVVD